MLVTSTTLTRWRQCSRDLPTERKLRLFGVACCRSINQHFTDDRCRRAIECAEAFADGNVKLADLVAAWHKAELLSNELSHHPEVELSETAYNAALAVYWCSMPPDAGWKLLENISITAQCANSRSTEPRERTSKPNFSATFSAEIHIAPETVAPPPPLQSRRRCMTPAISPHADPGRCPPGRRV